jgi:hypothetical protein
MKHSWAKKTFWTWITRNDINDVSLILLCYLTKTYGLPGLTMDTKCPNQVFYICLVDLQTICAKKGLEVMKIMKIIQMMIFANVCSTYSVVEVKTCFETWITRNDANGVNLYLLSYLVTLLAYLCSQWTQSFQIKYFIFDCSIYRLFVLNKGWKRDSLQIMICVKFCSTWSILELKTRFETWITRNDVNGVFFSPFIFNDTYALPVLTMDTKCSNQVFYIWLVVPNRGWKRDYLQMMIFINVCSTWSMVDVKMRFETWITRNVVNGVSLFHPSYLITLMAYLCLQSILKCPNQVLYVWLVNVQTICAN